MTPLLVVAQRGLAKAAERLLAAGADIHAQDGSGRTSLHHAVAYGKNSALIDFLCANGAAMDVLNDRKMTPLHYAALSNSVTPLHHTAFFLIELKCSELCFTSELTVMRRTSNR